MNLPTEYQSFIHLSRYARWDYSQTRRETWGETVDRYFDFFKEHLKENCNYEVTDKEVTVDYNHPLAGSNLDFTVTIQDIA